MAGEGLNDGAGFDVEDFDDARGAADGEQWVGGCWTAGPGGRAEGFGGEEEVVLEIADYFEAGFGVRAGDDGFFAADDGEDGVDSGRGEGVEVGAIVGVAGGALSGWVRGDVSGVYGGAGCGRVSAWWAGGRAGAGGRGSGGGDVRWRRFLQRGISRGRLAWGRLAWGRLWPWCGVRCAGLYSRGQRGGVQVRCEVGVTPGRGRRDETRACVTLPLPRPALLHCTNRFFCSAQRRSSFSSSHHLFCKQQTSSSNSFLHHPIYFATDPWHQYMRNTIYSSLVY